MRLEGELEDSLLRAAAEPDQAISRRPSQHLGLFIVRGEALDKRVCKLPSSVPMAFPSFVESLGGVYAEEPPVADSSHDPESLEHAKKRGDRLTGHANEAREFAERGSGARVDSGEDPSRGGRPCRFEHENIIGVEESGRIDPVRGRGEVVRL